MSFLRCLAPTLSFSLSVMSLSALAWGQQGHSLLASTAAELATDGQAFWTANANAMGQLANVPDAVWKSLQTAALEKPTHYVQIDAYVSDPAQFPAALFSYVAAVAQEGEAFVTENGTAPWRADQMYLLAKEAFRKGDDSNGLMIAGALAHYIGDLSQPLHVTKRYDGEVGQKTGIHKFFETDNLKSENAQTLSNEVSARAQVLLSQGNIEKTFSTDFLSGVFSEVSRTSLLVDTVHQIDQRLGRDNQGSQEQLVIAKERLADGSATLAVVLSKIWKESGRKDSSKSVKIDQKPKWIPIDYKETAAASGSKNPSNPQGGFSQEDCETL